MRIFLAFNDSRDIIDIPLCHDNGYVFIFYDYPYVIVFYVNKDMIIQNNISRLGNEITFVSWTK